MGTGGKKEYSRQFCNKWFEACSTSFVSQHPKSGELVWCSDTSSALICTALSEMAANGTELCSLVGAWLPALLAAIPCSHVPHHVTIAGVDRISEMLSTRGRSGALFASLGVAGCRWCIVRGRVGAQPALAALQVGGGLECQLMYVVDPKNAPAQLPDPQKMYLVDPTNAATINRVLQIFEMLQKCHLLSFEPGVACTVPLQETCCVCDCWPASSLRALQQTNHTLQVCELLTLRGQNHFIIERGCIARSS